MFQEIYVYIGGREGRSKVVLQVKLILIKILKTSHIFNDVFRRSRVLSKLIPIRNKAKSGLHTANTFVVSG